MSMTRCDECEHLIDADVDMGCFVGNDAIMCQWCREAHEIDDDPDSAEVQIGRRVDFLVRELDELCAMANNSETRDLIEKEVIGIGQVHFRAGLILDFLRADKAPKLKVISNVR